MRLSSFLPVPFLHTHTCVVDRQHLTIACVNFCNCNHHWLLQDGHTALMLAAIGGRSEMVKLLLHRHTATVDERDPVRWYISINLSFVQKNKMCWKLRNEKNGLIKIVVILVSMKLKSQVCIFSHVVLFKACKKMCLWIFKACTGVFRGNRTPSVYKHLSHEPLETPV